MVRKSSPVGGQDMEWNAPMPGTPIEPIPAGRYPADMESCVTVPEQIAFLAVSTGCSGA
jgi:hypothetical protein